MFCLYFIQGVPTGVQNTAIPVLLRSRGASWTNLGLMKLLSAPWFFKPLYAPLVSGRESGCLAAGLVVISAMNCVIGRASDVTVIAASLLGINVASACTNVVLDSVSVNQLIGADQSKEGTTVQVVGYKSGTVFSGGLLLLAQEYFGWERTFEVMAAMYVTCFAMLQFSLHLLNQFQII